MNFKYLTIEREFGSGGTEIAQRLSDNTGVPLFGNEIVERTARELGMSPEEVEEQEEMVTGSVLYTFYMMSQANSANSDMVTREGRIFVAMQEQIRTLSKQGSAIFLGHCASEALKDSADVIKVYIRCSDYARKKERIIDTYGIKADQADVIRERYDKKRAGYYRANTNRKWRDFEQYDIILDSAKISIDGCVGALEGILLG
jgi:cytidylate kinase